MRAIILLVLIGGCRSSEEISESAETRHESFDYQLKMKPQYGPEKTVDVEVVGLPDYQALAITIDPAENSNIEETETVLDFNSGYSAILSRKSNVCFVSKLPDISDYSETLSALSKPQTESGYMAQLICFVEVLENPALAEFGDWINNHCSSNDEAIVKALLCQQVSPDSITIPSLVSVLTAQQGCITVGYFTDDLGEGHLGCLSSVGVKNEVVETEFFLGTKEETNGHIHGVMLHQEPEIQFAVMVVSAMNQDMSSAYSGLILLSMSGTSIMIPMAENGTCGFAQLPATNVELLESFSKTQESRLAAFYVCEEETNVDLEQYDSHLLTQACKDLPTTLYKNCKRQPYEETESNFECKFMGLLFDVDGNADLACIL